MLPDANLQDFWLGGKGGWKGGRKKIGQNEGFSVLLPGEQPKTFGSKRTTLFVATEKI